MSIRLEMLQVARLAPRLLADSAELVARFLAAQQNPDGGFRDRAQRSDLYYTVFAVEGLSALRAPLDTESLHAYLSSFADSQGLDFVHLCCLARAWADRSALPPQRDKILERIECFRTRDGGYSPHPGSRFGTAYGCFLAVGAYQDLERAPLDPLKVVQCLKLLETADGAWANERNVPLGSTNATAAAVTLLRNLQIPVNPAVGGWLLERAHDQGGFCAAPGAPLPDLLSTATALHALAGLQRDLGPIKEKCLDFIDSLWTNEGGFFGHWSDDRVDSEYTFYGLLALGHLSL